LYILSTDFAIVISTKCLKQKLMITLQNFTHKIATNGALVAS
jgi:hypothetical protein